MRVTCAAATRQRTVLRVVLGLTVVAACAALVRRGRARRTVARAGERLGHVARFRLGQSRGVAYRLRGGKPSPEVTDNMLADRVRSSIGPVLHRLDLPHIHVMAEGHTVLLHGDVASDEDALEIDRAVRAVSGVVDVESHLHVGLLPSDSRPSEGALHRPPAPDGRSAASTAT